MNAETIKDFLVSLGFDIDEAGASKFDSVLAGTTANAIKMGLAVEGAALTVVAFTAKIASGLDNLYWASQRTGATVQGIQSIGYAVSQVGGSVDAARTSLESLSRFVRNNPGAEGFLNRLGVMDILSTLFQQQSRKIGMIVPSVVVSEKHTDTLEITEHPVEVGAAIADHAYKKPSEVVMEVGFAGGGSLLDFASNLTATSLLGLSPQQTYQEILDLQASRIPFDVVTGKRLYSNMLIRALEVTTDKTTENVLSAVLTLREVLISQTQQITVADKTNMKDGASTSAVLNTGNKTTKPPNTSLLKSITGNAASLLGLG